MSSPTGEANLGSSDRATLVVIDNDGEPEVPTLSQSPEESELTSSQEGSTSSPSLDESEPTIVPSDESDSENISLPSLGRGIAVTKDGSLLNADVLEEVAGITVAFRGGASISGASIKSSQAYQSSLTTTPSQTINIIGEIEIASEHVGKEADILVVVGAFNEVLETISVFFMLDSQEQWKVWDREPATLIGRQENVILSKTHLVEIYQGLIPVPAHIYIGFGYRLEETGSIYFNGERVIDVKITEEVENKNIQVRITEDVENNTPQDQKIVWHTEFSPNGEQIVIASSEGHVSLWDANNGNRLAKFTGHTRKVKSAVFSADGEWIVTSSHDGTARLLNGQNGSALGCAHWPRNPNAYWRNGVAYAAFSPNGEYIVTTSWDNSVRLWDAKTGEPIWVREHQAGVHHAAFSPNGQMIVTGSNDHTVRLWKTATGQTLKTLQGHEGNVWHVGFSPDGERVISASWDNTVRVWEVENGEVVMVLKD